MGLGSLTPLFYSHTSPGGFSLWDLTLLPGVTSLHGSHLHSLPPHVSPLPTLFLSLLGAHSGSLFSLGRSLYSASLSLTSPASCLVLYSRFRLSCLPLFYLSALSLRFSLGLSRFYRSLFTLHWALSFPAHLSGGNRLSLRLHTAPLSGPPAVLEAHIDSGGTSGGTTIDAFLPFLPGMESGISALGLTFTPALPAHCSLWDFRQISFCYILSLPAPSAGGSFTTFSLFSGSPAFTLSLPFMEELYFSLTLPAGSPPGIFVSRSWTLLSPSRSHCLEDSAFSWNFLSFFWSLWTLSTILGGSISFHLLTALYFPFSATLSLLSLLSLSLSFFSTHLCSASLGFLLPLS